MTKATKTPTGSPKPGTFQPGHAPLPGVGRPRKTEDHRRVDELCRAHTADAVETIVNLMATGNSAIRLAAAEALLNRGWGRAPEKLQVSGPDERPVQIESTAPLGPSPADLFRLMVEETRAKALAQREAEEAARLAGRLDPDGETDRAIH
jgi:hypothetical protein